MTSISPRTGGAKATRKKSVSKASATRGQEDSRAARIKQQEDAFTRSAQKRPAKLAKMYAERAHDVDKNRKVHRAQKHGPKQK
jgi:hypothetical protein